MDYKYLEQDELTIAEIFGCEEDLYATKGGSNE